MPAISVILPTRNRAELLRRSVQSVLAQTFTDFELIVVDDASSDATAQVLREFTDPRLIVIRRDQNAGAAAARNAGIGVARGEYIAFNDDDDYWLFNKLERQHHALVNAPVDVGWCLCGFIRFAQHNTCYIGGEKLWRQFDFHEGASRGPADGGSDWSLIATPGWLVRRQVLEVAGYFDERIASYDDWELGIRLDQNCKRVFVDEPLFVQDLFHGGGLTRLERARAHDLRIVMDKHDGYWADRPDVLARHWYIVGRIESIHEPGSTGRQALLRSLRLSPWRWRAWVALLLSFLGADLNRRIHRFFHRMRAISAIAER